MSDLPKLSGARWLLKEALHSFQGALGNVE
jgi:hypothetical protein